MKNPVTCLRCGHVWVPFVRKPKACPKCRNVRWWKPYVRGPKKKVVVAKQPSWGDRLFGRSR